MLDLHKSHIAVFIRFSKFSPSSEQGCQNETVLTIISHQWDALLAYSLCPFINYLRLYDHCVACVWPLLVHIQCPCISVHLQC